MCDWILHTTRVCATARVVTVAHWDDAWLTYRGCTACRTTSVAERRAWRTENWQCGFISNNSAHLGQGRDTLKSLSRSEDFVNGRRCSRRRGCCAATRCCKQHPRSPAPDQILRRFTYTRSAVVIVVVRGTKAESSSVRNRRGNTFGRPIRQRLYLDAGWCGTDHSRKQHVDRADHRYTRLFFLSITLWCLSEMEPFYFCKINPRFYPDSTNILKTSKKKRFLDVF